MNPGLRFNLVIIGASAGGIEALKLLFSMLPKDFPLPMVVVIHRLKNKESHLSEVLGRSSVLRIQEGRDGDILHPGNVYLAPPNYHLLVETDLRLVLNNEAPVTYSKPSIDVLFASAALACKEKVIAILMTGGNSDGATGLKMVQQTGGYTLVEDPKTARFSAMPEAALEQTQPDEIVKLEDIAEKLTLLAYSKEEKV